MARPVKFIAFDEETQKFRVNAEAVHLLRSIEGPVGVLAVSGKARQGKSYLLNQLIGRNDGFAVASTQRPCTKGLWIWSKPLTRIMPSGNFHLVLLDTEGINAFDQTGKFSTQIFCLAMLLSSCFVFNQMGPIDELAIKELALACEVIKGVRAKAEEGASGPEQLEHFTPTFFWLLRDFYLSLSGDGREATPNEYLEAALSNVEGRGPDVEAKNEMRNSIKALFPDRSCYVLIRPVTEESKLIRLDSVPPEALRPQFKAGVRDLMQTLSVKTRPKQLGNTVVNGRMLAELAQAYVSAINEGAVPTISSVWTSVAMAETARAAENAERCYDAEFDTGVEADEQILTSEHQRCVNLALLTFEKEAIGNDSVKAPQREKLLSDLHRRFDLFKQKTLAEAAARLDEFLLNMASELAQNAPHMNTEQLFQATMNKLKTLELQFHGSLKWERMYKFVIYNLGSAAVQKAAQAAEELGKMREAHQEALNKLQLNNALEEQHRDLEKKYLELHECHNSLIKESVKDKSEMELSKTLVQSVQEEKDRAEATLRREAQEQIRVVTNERDHLRTQLEEALRSNKNLQEALDMAAKEGDAGRRRQSGEQGPRVKAESSHSKRDWDQTQEQQQRERVRRDARSREEQTQTEALRRDLMEAQRVNAELEKRLFDLRSSAGQRPSDVRMGGTSAEMNALQTQLNDTLQALKAAEEKIRTMEISSNGQPPHWNSPGRDATLRWSNVSRAEHHPASQKLSEDEIGRMTVAQLKEWLMKNDYEDIVWNSLQRGTPKKADWIQMVKDRI